MQDVYQFLYHLVKTNDTLVIGVSGGPDSMALLSILVQIRAKKKITIVVAHVNHHLRKASDKEALMVQKYCDEHQLKYEYMVITDYSHDNLESEARLKRYAFFESLMDKYKAQYLLTAHHGDDLMETILMRLVRGSTLKGYSGFSKITSLDHYQVVRPLITVTKAEIEAYCHTNKIPYALDKSNHSMLYTRNRYRAKILPFLKKENSKVHLKFLKYSEELSACTHYVDEIVNQKLKGVYQNKILDLKAFNELDPFIQKQVLCHILESAYLSDINLINDHHIALLQSMINNKKTNMYITLPNQMIARKEYNKLYFDTLKPSTTYDYEFDESLALPNGHMIRLSNQYVKSNDVCALNSDEIVLPIRVRTRERGDKMAVKGLTGHQKVSDIFINAKLSESKRSEYPLVTDSANHLLWIPGIKKSVYCHAKNEKYDIILRYY